MTAPKQISGAYIFAYEQLNKSLLQQRRRRLLSPPSPPYCCPTYVVVCDTNVCQQMLANNCWTTFVCRVSAALGITWQCVDTFTAVTRDGKYRDIFENIGYLLIFDTQACVCLPPVHGVHNGWRQFRVTQAKHKRKPNEIRSLINNRLI